LIDHAGSRAAFATLSLLPLIALWVAHLVPHEAPAPAAPPNVRRPAWDLLSTPMLRRLLLVNWFTSASWDVHGFVVPLLGHERGFSASAIAAVLGTFALAITGVRLIVPILAHRLDEAQTLRAALWLIATAFAAYPFAKSPWAMGACAACLGLALGSSQPMIMAALHQITPAKRHGEAIALRSMAISGSSTLLPLTFGAAGALVGVSGLFWVMAALVSGGALLARELDPHAAAAPAE
ncbi:MAG: MFS transporter, partial [Polyangiales bacterium]